MKNLLEKTVRAVVSEEVPPDVHPYDFRLQELIRRLAQELPSDEAYLEVGGRDGEYFEQALKAGKDITAYATVTPAELSSGSSEIFKSMVKGKAESHPECLFFDGDFFLYMANRGAFHKPVGIYFYDGMCRQSSLRAAIGRARNFLAPQSIYLVGHWARAEARKGTWEGLELLRAKCMCFQEIGTGAYDSVEGFAEGVGAFYLEI